MRLDEKLGNIAEALSVPGSWITDGGIVAFDAMG